MILEFDYDYKRRWTFKDLSDFLYKVFSSDDILSPLEKRTIKRKILEIYKDYEADKILIKDFKKAWGKDRSTVAKILLGQEKYKKAYPLVKLADNEIETIKEILAVSKELFDVFIDPYDYSIKVRLVDIKTIRLRVNGDL